LQSVTLFAQTVIKLELIKESKTVQLEDKIREILFHLGQNIIVHKIDQENSVLEIDYERYVKDISSLLEQTGQESHPES
jgi:hypothetical protein